MKNNKKLYLFTVGIRPVSSCDKDVLEVYISSDSASKPFGRHKVTQNWGMTGFTTEITKVTV